jgi:hypothetical protein
MSFISNLLREIHTALVIVYFDRLRIWLRIPLPPSDLQRLARLCHALHHEDGPAPFDWRYRQKLEIYQPKDEALRLLARLPDDVLLNYGEPAFNLILANAMDAERMLDIFQTGFRQRWHGNKGGVSYPGGFSTRTMPKPGERRAGIWFNCYIDKPCKITGRWHCFHFESKLEGRRFLHRIGLNHPRDLVDFDFRRYFGDTVRFYTLDLTRLGRYHDNLIRHARRRRVQAGDLRRGGLLYRALSIQYDDHGDPVDASLQQFVDRYGRFVGKNRPYITYDHDAESIFRLHILDRIGQSSDFNGNSVHLPSGTPDNPPATVGEIRT